MALRSAGEHNFQALPDHTRPVSHREAARCWCGPDPRLLSTRLRSWGRRLSTAPTSGIPSPTHRPQTPTETSRALRARVMTAGRPSTR